MLLFTLLKYLFLLTGKYSPSKMELDREMACGLSCKCVFRSSSCREIPNNGKATVHPDFAAFFFFFFFFPNSFLGQIKDSLYSQLHFPRLDDASF